MSVESELDEHAPPELSLKSPLVYVFFFFTLQQMFFLKLDGEHCSRYEFRIRNNSIAQKIKS